MRHAGTLAGVCFGVLMGMTQAGRADDDASLLTTRVIPLDQRYAIGQPFRIAVDITNSGQATQFVTWPDGMYKCVVAITGPTGQPVPCINPTNGVSYQTLHDANEPGSRIDPGQTKRLMTGLDLARHYYIAEPGLYQVAYKGSGLSGWSGESRKRSIPGSVPVDIVVDSGPLSSELRAIGRVLSVLPASWKLEWSETVGPVSPAGRTGANGVELTLLHGVHTIGAPVITIWLTAAPAGLLPQNGQEVSEELGRTDSGFVYLLVPQPLQLIWPDARTDIATALEAVS